MCTLTADSPASPALRAVPPLQAGGYTEKRWWVGANGDDEGWRWRSYRNATHPSFWVATAHPDMRRYCGGTPAYAYQKDDGHPRAGAEAVFRYRSLFDIIEMPWDWPAEVNYHEATAFLRWKAACEGSGATYRVPTEAEYHLLRADPVPFPEASTGEGVPAAGRSSAAGVSEAAHLSALVAAATPRRLRSAVGTVTFPGVDAPAADADAPVDVLGRVLLPDGPADGAEAEAKAASALAAGDAAARVDVMMQPYAPGNLNMRWHSSTPVHMYPPSSAGFHDPHGNVWQWVEVRHRCSCGCCSCLQAACMGMGCGIREDGWTAGRPHVAIVHAPYAARRFRLLASPSHFLLSSAFPPSRAFFPLPAGSLRPAAGLRDPLPVRRLLGALLRRLAHGHDGRQLGVHGRRGQQLRALPLPAPLLPAPRLPLRACACGGQGGVPGRRDGV